MRIAIIAPPWLAVPPSAYGGTEAMLDTLARGLVAAGQDVLLFTTGDSTCPVPKAWTFEHSLGIGTTGVAAELRHVIAAYDVVRDYDIVHDHTLIGPVYAQRFAEAAVLTTNHGPFQSDLGPIYRAIAPRVGVIAISADQAARAGDMELAGVIHHGLDLSAVRPGPGDGGYAVFLGRMIPDKGVDVAARVARAVGMPLVIAAKMSEPAERLYFAECVEPLLGGDIEYVGEIEAKAKFDLLGGATCLLNPIAWPEPFGMVMIEALATGTPVVATARGAAPEIIEEGVTGFLCSDEASLGAALGVVGGLDRRACRQAAEARFSMARMAADHLVLFEEVLRRRHQVRLRAQPTSPET